MRESDKGKGLKCRISLLHKVHNLNYEVFYYVYYLFNDFMNFGSSGNRGVCIGMVAVTRATKEFFFFF